MPASVEDFYAARPLKGRHVHLEALGPQHAPDLFAAADDDAVFEHLSYRRPRTLHETEQLIAHYASMPSVVPWVQIEATSGHVAGMTTYYDLEPTLRTVAIGHTWIARRHWRTALNTEAKLLLLTRAFDTLECVRVVWHTDIRNQRSQSAIKRIGGRPEGVLRKHKLRVDGSWRDTMVFSMIDDEWPAARTALQARLHR